MRIAARLTILAVLVPISTPLEANGRVIYHPSSTGCGAFHVVPTATITPSGQSSFNAIAQTSNRDVWAVGSINLHGSVGDFTSSQQPLVAHWNGARWQNWMPDSQAIKGSFYGVAVTSPTDVWAVGGDTRSSKDTPLAFHWNGSAWRSFPVSPPTAKPWKAITLWGVSATGASNAWAVGNYIAGDGADRNVPLVEHWNGTRWKASRPPYPNARRSPFATLNSISIHGGHMLAVGFYTASDFTDRPLIDALTRSAWRITGRTGGDRTLQSVAIVPGGPAWAVGDNNSTNDFESILHRTSRGWSTSKGALPGATLSAVAGERVDDVWAAGMNEIGNTDLPGAERWNGRRWAAASMARLPKGTEQGEANGLSVSGRTVWLAGDLTHPASGRELALVERLRECPGQ